MLSPTYLFAGRRALIFDLSVAHRLFVLLRSLTLRWSWILKYQVILIIVAQNCFFTVRWFIRWLVFLRDAFKTAFFRINNIPFLHAGHLYLLLWSAWRYDYAVPPGNQAVDITSNVGWSIQVGWQPMLLLWDLPQKFIREVVAIKTEHIVFVGFKFFHDDRQHLIDNIHRFYPEAIHLYTLAELKHVVRLRPHLVYSSAVKQSIATVSVLRAIDFNASVINSHPYFVKFLIMNQR